MCASCAPPCATALGWLLTFVVKLHNIIEPEQNPAEYYHTMGQQFRRARQVAGGKKTLPLALQANAQRHIHLQHFTRLGTLFLKKLKLICNVAICDCDVPGTARRLADVHRRQPIMSPTTVWRVTSRKNASVSYVVAERVGRDSVLSYCVWFLRRRLDVSSSARARPRPGLIDVLCLLFCLRWDLSVKVFDVLSPFFLFVGILQRL